MPRSLFFFLIIYQQSLFNDHEVISLQGTFTRTANHSAINSSHIFLLRVGIVSVWAICLLFSGVCNSLILHLGKKRQWRKWSRREKWKSLHLELRKVIVKNMFKINNRLGYPPMNPRTVLGGAGKCIKTNLRGYFSPMKLLLF